MRPEQLDPMFACIPDHLRNLRVFIDAAEAFHTLAQAADIQLPAELSPEVIDTVLAAKAARAASELLLARIFADLWYCSNFDAGRWEPLLNVDSRNIERAVEHCYYVLITSGATGVGDLARLCTSPERCAGARRALDHLASLDGANRKCVDHLRSGIP